MDGTECIIKSKVFCDVKSVNVHVKDANSFAEYANLLIDNIKSPYFSVNDVREEPDDIDSAPKILSTLYVHQVKREFNLDGVSNFHFFKVVSDSFSFHEEFYRKYGDAEMCDYMFFSLWFSSDNTCAAFKDSHLGKKDWLECKICGQWFHEPFFMA